jgi:hypothetical protein
LSQKAVEPQPPYLGRIGISVNLILFGFCRAGATEASDKVEKIQNMICDHLMGRPRLPLDAIGRRFAQPLILYYFVDVL